MKLTLSEWEHLLWQQCSSWSDSPGQSNAKVSSGERCPSHCLTLPALSDKKLIILCHRNSEGGVWAWAAFWRSQRTRLLTAEHQIGDRCSTRVRNWFGTLELGYSANRCWVLWILVRYRTRKKRSHRSIRFTWSINPSSHASSMKTMYVKIMRQSDTSHL